MDRKIWKYELKLDRTQTVALPKGAEILSVAVQYDVPCIWALVDPGAPIEGREILIVGTGHAVSNEIEKERFLGTIIMANGSLVWHVFE